MISISGECISAMRLELFRCTALCRFSSLSSLMKLRSFTKLSKVYSINRCMASRGSSASSLSFCSADRSL